MTTSNEEIVRKKFEQEKSRKEESNQRVRERVRTFGRVVAWLVAVSFTVMALVTLYWEYPFLLELLAGHREGWVPTNLIVTLLVLVVLLIVFLAVLIFLAWKSRQSSDR